MRKVLYISGTRADYGLMREALFLVRRHPKLKIEIAATGMHLMPRFGRTIDEIKKDNFKIHKIDARYRRDVKKAAADFLGNFILKLSKLTRHIRPDIILILGDRAEMLGAAVVGAYLGLPVVHIHGGEVSSTVDETVRHAITKLSHIHLVATKKSAARLIKMGEDAWRVYRVGAPALDNILNKKLFSRKEISKKYNLNLTEPVLLVIQHPVTAEIERASSHMKETMEAIKKIACQAIIIYPNADAGGRKIIRVIEAYRKYPFFRIYKSIPSKEYLSLMNVASAMIGNSSSGIIEAPSFQLPAINIGTRQEGRERADNIIQADYDREQIKKAIEKAIFDKKFKKRVRECKNSYGDGKTANRIIKILVKTKIDKKLLDKKISY